MNDVHGPLDTQSLLALRKHLHIVHHLPGRLRLRLGPALWGLGTELGQYSLERLLDQLDGIEDIRINKAVASVVIQYDPQRIPPDDWETLVLGDEVAAGSLVADWLDRYRHLMNSSRTERSEQ